MSYRVVSHCVVCGAPEYIPVAWMGIYPPSPQKSCSCQQKQVYQVDVGPDFNETKFQKFQRAVQQAREAEKKVKEIRERQKLTEEMIKQSKNNPDMSGMESLAKALGQFEDEDKETCSEPDMIERGEIYEPKKSDVDVDIDVKIDRLETLIIKMVEALQKINHRLSKLEPKE